jgi:tetratricopeptide (TPR) repeat protein
MLHYALGKAYLKQHSLNEALRHFQEAIDTSPVYSPETHLALADTFEEKGEQNDATDLYRETITRAPKFAPAYVAFARALLNRPEKGKNADAAIAMLQKAIDLPPQSAELYRTYGKALKEKNDWQGAAKRFEEAVEIEPRSVLTRCLLGEALLHTKQPYRAVAQYRKAVALAPQHAPAHVGLGKAHFDRGDFKDAITHLQTALEIDPHNDSKGEIAAQLDMAIARDKELEEEVDRRKTEAEAKPLNAAALYRYGVALRKSHDFTGAIAEFRKAVKADPKDVPACDALAEALYDSGNFDEALAQFRRGIDLEPKAIARMEHVAALLRLVNDLSGAIAELKRISEIDYSNPKRLHKLGLALAETKNDTEALAYYQKAIDKGLKDPQIYSDIGVALMSQGKFKAARASLDRAVRELLQKKDPRWTLAEKRLQDCDRFLALDRKVVEYLKHGTLATDSREALELAELCRTYKQYHRCAAYFYGEALKDTFVQLGKEVDVLRDDAARSALSAAAGKGREPKQPDSLEKEKLRGQALGLLKATLARQEKNNINGRLEARLEVWRRLSQWRSDADFASVRDPKALALLPAAEQADWKKLWSEVERVLNAAPALVSTTVSRGDLTDRDRERTVELKLSAGQTCVIDLFSTAFEPECRLLDAQDKRVAKSTKAGANLSRLMHTSHEDATFQIIATSFQARGTGAYVLTIRKFAENVR